MEPLILTACTDGYRTVALALAADAVGHGLDILIKPYADLGSRPDNCRQKAIVINEVLTALMAGSQRRPILWIDADGNLLRRPTADHLSTLADTADFAACPSRAGLGRRFCTGTLWVNATEAAAQFTVHWANLCQNGDGTDEAQLHIAVEAMGKEVRFAELPVSWGWLPRDGPPTKETVILHRLSSQKRRPVGNPPR